MKKIIFLFVLFLFSSCAGIKQPAPMTQARISKVKNGRVVSKSRTMKLGKCEKKRKRVKRSNSRTRTPYG